MTFNSTIKRKKGNCIDCGNEAYLTAKRCPYCYSKHRYKINNKKSSSKKMIPSATKPIKMTSHKDTTELNEWFVDKEKILIRNPRCWNCNDFIPLRFARAAVAHIFPKSIFESIATHEENFLICGAGCCHDKTHTVERFSRMAVFPMAVRKFLKFYTNITERHKYLFLFIEAAREHMSEKEYQEVTNFFNQ